MSYLVLARKWRPQTFETVTGQEHITRVLINAIKSSRLAHSFLFSGPRGVGKTSTARILAKALNCNEGPTPTPCNECSLCREITSGSSSSIIEIDGASNNSVDDIRALREKVGMISTSGRFKIYIIDEVHMLSQAAFNALLKTLEEPPAHVKFIFATTEIHKIPATILSRCQRFDFKRIPPNRIVENIQQILDRENISTDSKVLSLIAKAADGSMRDALSILDQVISSSGPMISESEVEALLGLVGREKLQTMAEVIAQGDAGATLTQLSAVLSMGGTLEIYWQQLMEYFRDGLMLRIARKGVDLSEEEISAVEKVLKPLSNEDLIRILKNLAEGFDRLRNSQQPLILAETVLLRLCDQRPFVGLGDIIARLKELEKGLGNKVGLPVPATKPARSVNTTPRHATPLQTAPKENFSPTAKPVQAKIEKPGDTQELYETLVSRVNKKKSLAALLSHGKIVEFDKNQVVFGFAKSFEKMVNSKNIDILQRELEKILDHPVRVEFSKENCSSNKPQVPKDEISALPKDEMEMVENNPIYRKITEMFDAKIVNIQKVV